LVFKNIVFKHLRMWNNLYNSSQFISFQSMQFKACSFTENACLAYITIWVIFYQRWLCQVMFFQKYTYKSRS